MILIYALILSLRKIYPVHFAIDFGLYLVKVYPMKVF